VSSVRRVALRYAAYDAFSLSLWERGGVRASGRTYIMKAQKVKYLTKTVK